MARAQRSAPGRAVVVLLLGLALVGACAPNAAPRTASAPELPTSAPAIAQPEPRQHVTVAIPAASLSTFPLLLGKQAGIFEQYGIDLTVTAMQANTAIAAVISGGVDYATPSGSLLRAIATGAPLRLVVSIADRSNHLLLVDPKVIREGRDLAGKRIVINSPGDNTQLEAEAALQHFGLDKQSASYLAIPDNAHKLLAIQTGAADAAVTNVPFNFQGEPMGLSVLLNFVNLYELPTASLATSEERIASRPAAIQRMVDATLAATRYTRTNRAEAVREIAREFDLDAQRANAAYDLVKDMWSATGVLSEGALRNAIEPLDLSPPPTVQTVFDPRFVNAARRG
jgi:ABC-type nitrate/sulfonate/bicarbonate transport system substrate-binding protein